MMRFRYLGESERERFSKALHAVLPAWSSHWFMAGVEGLTLTEHSNRHHPSSLTWFRSGIGDEFVLVGATVSGYTRFSAQVLNCAEALSPGEIPTHPSTQMITKICTAVGADLVQRVVKFDASEVSSIQEQSPEPSFDRPYSGLLRFSVAIGPLAEPLSIILSPGLSERWLAAHRQANASRTRAGLVPRMQAIGPASLPVQVELRDDALSVAEIHRLQVGDVIHLAASIRQPLVVTTNDGWIVGHCHLGRVKDRKAIRLIKSTENKKNV